MEPHILAVDDDPTIREMIDEYFSMNGFSVHSASNGAEMREVLADQPVAAVLLDVRMPGEDGFALCRYLREHHDVGILMLTGSTDTIDRVLGLEIGADDYVAKPFDLRELLARVRSVLRRMQTQPADPKPAKTTDADVGSTIAVGDATLNPATQSLRTASGETLTLGAAEFRLLMAFVENPNRVLSRDQLLNLTENRDWDPFDRSIDVRITRLRKKIEAKPGKPRFLRTIRGSGYLFAPKGEA